MNPNKLKNVVRHLDSKFYVPGLGYTPDPEQTGWLLEATRAIRGILVELGMLFDSHEEAVRFLMGTIFDAMLNSVEGLDEFQSLNELREACGEAGLVKEWEIALLTERDIRLEIEVKYAGMLVRGYSEE